MKHLITSASVALVLWTPTASVAQDFLGGLARSAAQSAAQRLMNRAVTAATTPRQPVAPPANTQTTPPVSPSTSGPSKSGPSTSAPSTSGPAAQALPADFPLPRPLNWAPSLRRPTQMQFSQADQDARVAFDQIGRYSCNDCEGGYSFDSWPRHEVPGIGVGNYQLENRLGALKVGEALRWTGSRTRTQYAITVTSDRGIGPWPCKQLKWTGDRGETHVERLGLICKPTENWHTVL